MKTAHYDVEYYVHHMQSIPAPEWTGKTLADICPGLIERSELKKLCTKEGSLGFDPEDIFNGAVSDQEIVARTNPRERMLVALYKMRGLGVIPEGYESE